jgi:hypothetical protein
LKKNNQLLCGDKDAGIEELEVELKTRPWATKSALREICPGLCHRLGVGVRMAGTDTHVLATDVGTPH